MGQRKVRPCDHHVRIAIGLMIFLVFGCVRTTATDSPEPRSPEPRSPPIADARAELSTYIEDVTQASAYRYGARDDRDHEMDAVKIIAGPEAGGFIGVYHAYIERSDTYYVHLATSSDLMRWTWRRQLADRASMPAIKRAPDGGYVLTWEQEPRNHLKFAYYKGWKDILAGVASKTFDAPNRLSSCAEGTPNLYTASSASVDVGFHFYANCDLDRQARGTTDWKSWSAAERPLLDRAVLVHGVMGGVGDRDVLTFEGFDFTLIEGQVIRDDWRSWRVFLHDDETGEAEPLNIRTHAGSVAFTNPTIEYIEISGQSAILVTLFVPQEGAKGNEVGELIYYRIYTPVDRD